MSFGLIGVCFWLLNKSKEAGSQNYFSWDWMLPYWTEQQNTPLGPSVPSQIFWLVGEGWETQAPFTEALYWKGTQNIQPTAPSSYTTIAPTHSTTTLCSDAQSWAAGLHVDHDQFLYISRLSSMPQYFLKTCLEPLKAEQTK